MKILVIDQCSAQKIYDDSVDPLDVDEIDGPPHEIITEHPHNGIKASDLYTGKQNRRVASAVRTLRTNQHTVDRHIVSAGFGLVSEDELLPPYDVTFANMSSNEIEQRGQNLNLTADLRDQLQQEPAYDIAFFPLGADYYRAFDIEVVLSRTPPETTVVLFNKEDCTADRPSVLSLSARTEQARDHGAAVIGLKGTYLNNFATRLGDTDAPVTESQLREYCTAVKSANQTNFDAYQ